MRKVKLLEIHIEWDYHSDYDSDYTSKIANIVATQEWTEVSEEEFNLIKEYCEIKNHSSSTPKYILVEWHDNLSLDGDMFKNMRASLDNHNRLVKKMKEEKEIRRQKGKLAREQRNLKKKQKEIENAKRILKEYGIEGNNNESS